jgi:hypothetical protein
MAGQARRVNVCSNSQRKANAAPRALFVVDSIVADARGRACRTKHPTQRRNFAKNRVGKFLTRGAFLLPNGRL